MGIDNFIIKEFVSKDVYNKYYERAWSFFDPRLLDVVSFIREKLGRSITINNWHNGGKFSQRGLRHNISQIVKEKTKKGQIYLSAHTLGMAIDFDVKGMTANEVRVWIYENKDLLPYKIRLESEVSWVHLDVEDYGQVGKITFFNA